MRFSFALLLILAAACSPYDPDFLPMRGDTGVAGSGGTGGDASDSDSGDTAECRMVPDSPCELVCIERCNGEDDDCDGIIDNNGAASLCGIPNAEATCDEGMCRLVRCQGDYADCNGLEVDGCEALLTDPSNCGLCGATCSFPNAVPRCSQGRCLKGDCMEGFGDCDGQPSNGCETPLTEVDSCGACGEACEVGPNALPSCSTGVCGVGDCIGNYADCDGMPENGCEQALDDPQNCGECAMDCGDLPNATATCTASECVGLVCLGDYQNCDGLGGNGCEALLNEADNCGACGMACDLPNVAVHVCDTGGGNAVCGIDDTAPNGGCAPGFSDCNNTDSDGCERALNTPTDCGGCDTPCALTNAITSCDTGTCQFVDCAPGFEDCDENGTCESLSADPDNCGACDNVCPLNMMNCSGGRCRLTACPTGEADCNDDDMCEPLNTASNCGTCGVLCPATVTNGTSSCGTGTCTITCNANFANCDGNPTNGCEVDLRSVNSCGACGTTCSSANASSVCSSGTCGLGMCTAGFGNCDAMAGNGCEAALNTPTNCGDCGNNCAGRPNTTSAGCNNGTCSFTCTAGFGNCNGMQTDGCETNVTTSTANCGACGTNCAGLMNVAAATCSNSGCQITTCNAGFADCDGLPGNGCERSITTLSDCGACGTACSFPNAAATCSTSGVCTMGTCNTGFGDCTSAAGCETQVNTTSNCGACGRVCASGETCNNGTCAPANCPAGFSYCGGSTCIDIRGSCPPWPGCLNGKPGDNNCGACGYRCPLYNGDHCCL